MKHLSGAVLPAVLIAAVLLLNHLPLGHPLEVYVATFIVASVLYLWLARVTLTTEVLRGQLWMLIAASILLRASFLPVSPVGSDDVYRYIWDGRVEAHGINPYRYAPEAPELQALHSEALPAKVNYPSMKTVYFPIAQ